MDIKTDESELGKVPQACNLGRLRLEDPELKKSQVVHRLSQTKGKVVEGLEGLA